MALNPLGRFGVCTNCCEVACPEGAEMTCSGDLADYQMKVVISGTANGSCETCATLDGTYYLDYTGYTISHNWSLSLGEVSCFTDVVIGGSISCYTLPAQHSTLAVDITLTTTGPWGPAGWAKDQSDYVYDCDGVTNLDLTFTSQPPTLPCDFSSATAVASLVYSP